MSQQAAKRRRTQASNGYKHLAPQQRPHYSKRDVKTLAKRLERILANERAMQKGKGKPK